MTEVLFYHLQNMSLDNVLPPLLEKSLERGWRVVVQSTSPERADALDAHLWTYRDDSFLPHATWRVGDAQDQPIVPPIPIPMSGWFWFSTATMTTRWPRRGAPGQTASRAASRSPTGRLTNRAGGGGGNSDSLRSVISLVLARWL